MINLLPTDDKRQLRAARANTLLIRYNVLMLGAVGFMLLAIAAVFIYLQSTKAAAEQSISDNRAKVDGYGLVKSQADAFKSNLSVAKQILDKDVPYTSVILKIAQLLPDGVVLDNLSLDASTFGTPTVLSAKAKSYDGALALKNAFQKSDLFSDVHFQSIASDPKSDSAYPVAINISVTIKKEAVQ